MSVVLVTGAGGYVGCNLVAMLAAQGYKVRGTVRSKKDETKVAALRKVCPNIELFEADLLSDEGWKEAIEGCEFVHHVASPFPLAPPKREEDLVKPAVEGTTRVLKIAIECKSVKKVILTSSFAAVGSGHPDAPTEKVFNEDDWSNIEKCDPYPKSKTLAEKAAWECLEKQPADRGMELTTINPVLVLGPMKSKAPCTSAEIISRLMMRQLPACPKLSFAIVDVRDVCTAHIKAMNEPSSSGKRILVFNKNMWMVDVAKILAEKYNPQGYSVPTGNLPYFMLYLVSFFDKGVRSILSRVGKESYLTSARSKEILKMEYTDIQSTILDMAESMIELGVIPDKRRKK